MSENSYFSSYQEALIFKLTNYMSKFVNIHYNNTYCVVNFIL